MFSLREREAIRQYKYNGGDLSLLYKHVLSPFAQWLIDEFTPTSVAPNVITLLGLVFVVICALVHLYHDPNLSGNCPPWLCYYTGLSLFIYQTLDNMDGKQARRTGSSSALGMLFDHTCDALNAVISSIAIANVLGTGWSPRIFLFYMFAYCPFFFQTWLEYYSGSMWLPIFNGASEGLMMTISLCIISAIMGPTWWFQVVYIDISSMNIHIAGVPFDVLVIMGIIISLGTFTSQVMQAIQVCKEKRRSLADPFFAMLPFLSLTICSGLWVIFNPLSMKVYGVQTYFIIGSVFVEMVVNILVAHIAKQALVPYSRQNYKVLVVVPINMALGSPIPDALILTVVCCVTIISALYYIIDICAEFAEALNIHIFVLGPRNRSD